MNQETEKTHFLNKKHRGFINTKCRPKQRDKKPRDVVEKQWRASVVRQSRGHRFAALYFWGVHLGQSRPRHPVSMARDSRERIPRAPGPHPNISYRTWILPAAAVETVLARCVRSNSSHRPRDGVPRVDSVGDRTRHQRFRIHPNGSATERSRSWICWHRSFGRSVGPSDIFQRLRSILISTYSNEGMHI